MLPNTIINIRLMKDLKFKDKMNHYLFIFMIIILIITIYMLIVWTYIRQIQNYQVKMTLVSKIINKIMNN